MPFRSFLLTASFDQHRIQMAGVSMSQAEYDAKKEKFVELYESWLDNSRNKKKQIHVTHLVHGKPHYTFTDTSSSLCCFWTDS